MAYRRKTRRGSRYRKKRARRGRVKKIPKRTRNTIKRVVNQMVEKKVRYLADADLNNSNVAGTLHKRQTLIDVDQGVERDNRIGDRIRVRNIQCDLFIINGSGQPLDVTAYIIKAKFHTDNLTDDSFLWKSPSGGYHTFANNFGRKSMALWDINPDRYIMLAKKTKHFEGAGFDSYTGRLTLRYNQPFNVDFRKDLEGPDFQKQRVYFIWYANVPTQGEGAIQNGFEYKAGAITCVHYTDI